MLIPILSIGGSNSMLEDCAYFVYSLLQMYILCIFLYFLLEINDSTALYFDFILFVLQKKSSKDVSNEETRRDGPLVNYYKY